jgi:DNA-binding Lrp family transcriptional regulator
MTKNKAIPVNLDFIDFQLLTTLQNEGRIPVVELSRKVNLSPTLSIRFEQRPPFRVQ